MMQVFDKYSAARFSFYILLGIGLVLHGGCRGAFQKARIKSGFEKDRVGSHQAGAEVFKPVVDNVVAQMIARVESESMDPPMFEQVNGSNMFQMPVRRITFISIENKSAEELGDYKDHIKELIGQKIGESPAFEMVSDKAVSAALRQTGLRPEDLFLPNHLNHFRNEMGNQGNFDYMLFAKLTTGTTIDNRDMQRDYMLTLNLVDVNTYREIKVSEPISKEYLRSLKGRVGSWFK